MDVLENIIETHYPMDNGKYYVAEVHMAVGNRISQEADYWVCRRGSDTKMYIGNSIARDKVDEAISRFKDPEEA